MGVFDNLLARFGYLKADQFKDAPKFLLDMAAEQKWNIPDYGLYYNQAELMQRLSWVYTAIYYTSAYAAGVPFGVMRLRGEKTIDIPNHEFELLLNAPNPSQSRFEFLQATFAYLKLNGNAYWWLNRADEKARPDEIWILPPFRVKPDPDGRMYLNGYLYDADGQEQLLPPEQVIHFRSYHPNHEFIGLSPIESIAAVSAGDLGQQSWNAKRYGKNNGRLPGILAFGDYVQETQWEQIKNSIKKASNDQEYMLLRGVGKGGVELIATANQKDMEFLASRQFTKEEIFSVLAPGLASVLDVNATEANAKSGMATLIDFAVYPMLQQVQQKITSAVLPSYGIKLVAEFEDIRIKDRAIQFREQELYAQTHTVDEIREEYYNDDPLGDERGDLLPAQIGQTTGTPGDERPEAVMPDQPITDGEPEDETPDETPEPEQENEEENQEARAEKARWKRKALAAMKRGESAAVTFTSAVIPTVESTTITGLLANAKTPEDVTAAFATRATVTPANPYTEIVAVIRDAIKALEVGG